MNSKLGFVEAEKANAAIDREMQQFLDRVTITKISPVDEYKYKWGGTTPWEVDLDEFLIKGIHFSSLLESNAPAAAERLFEAAERSNAPWLTRFIKDIWLPQENLHWIPFYRYLDYTALKSKNLDQEIEGVRSREFTIGKDYTATMAVTYGWLQELLTWSFYRAMYSRLLSNNEDRLQIYYPSEDRHADSILAQILQDISAQENFHRRFYLTAIRTILKYRPDLSEEFICSLVKFDMPHRTMLPDLPKDAAAKIGRKLGFDIKRALSEIVDVAFNAVGYEGVGRVAIGYAAHHSMPYESNYVANVFEPFSRVRGSPINRIIGKFVVNKYGK